MKRSRLLLLIGVLGLVLVAFLIVRANLVAGRQRAAADSIVVGTYEVRLEATRFLSSMQDIEAGARGFVIARRPEFLESFIVGRQNAPRQLDRLAALVNDNPAQQRRLDRLRRLATARTAAAEEVVARARTGGNGLAEDAVANGAGKRLMDALRVETAGFLAEEIRLLSVRRGAATQAADNDRWLSLLLGGFGILAAVGAIVTSALLVRARDRAELAAAKIRNSVALEGAGAASWDIDVETGEGFWSPAHFDFLGLPRHPEGRASMAMWRERVHPDDLAATDAAFAKSLATGETYRATFRVIRADTGEVRWLSGYGRATVGGRGERSMGVVLDVTDERAAVNALRVAEQRNRYLLLLEERLRAASSVREGLSAACELLGRELGATLVCVAQLEDNREYSVVESEWRAGDTPSTLGRHRLGDFGAERVMRFLTGELLTVEDVLTDPRTSLPEEQAAYAALEARAILNVPILRDEQVRGFLSIAISKPHRWSDGEIELARETLERAWQAAERARAELQLAASEAQFRVTTEALPGLLFVTTNEGANIFANKQYCDFTGREQSELLGSRWAEVIHPDDVALAWETWRAAAAVGSPYQSEFRFRRHDGAWRWHMVRGLPVRADDGLISKWIGVCVDIQDRHDVEEELQRRVDRAVAEREHTMAQLHEVQKTETIGQLSSGIAHDFNNLLTPIVGALDLLHRKYQDDPRSVRMISGAQQSAERARVLISRLLTFARRQQLEARPVDLVGLTENMIDMIGRTIGPQIEIVLDMADGLPAAQVDPNQFELALLNLCVNARDAMPGGGTLTIASDCVDETSSDRGDLRPGSYIRVCVTDTGEGMDADTLRRATEPFYSTKGVGKGTGLGLSMVQGLVAQLGGAVHLRSTLGEGTTVTLWLPTTAGPADRRAATTNPDELPETAPINVLLVDDEELVLSANAEMLEALGHRVTRAASPAAALQLLGTNDIDLLLTDYLMPSMTGAELVAAARALKPELPAAIITGYADRAFTDADIAKLSKPFNLAELARLVSSLA